MTNSDNLLSYLDGENDHLGRQGVLVSLFRGLVFFLRNGVSDLEQNGLDHLVEDGMEDMRRDA